jgi:DNA-binding transcriptional regulator YiaG
MADYTKAFREEVARLARKEVRSELSQLKRNSAQHRRDIAALKRQNADLQRRLTFLERQERKRVAEPDAAQDTTLRFSAKWLARHRQKLGLSAENYGRLIDVSGQSIYLWEQGKAKPRQAQLAKLASVRGLGKREAEQRLALLDQG